jgi:hypothetical protein
LIQAQFFILHLFSQHNTMEKTKIKNISQRCIDLCRKCIEECRSNARESKEKGMSECERLSIACAAACRKVIVTRKITSDLLQQCADACFACATECEKHALPIAKPVQKPAAFVKRNATAWQDNGRIISFSFVTTQFPF